MNSRTKLAEFLGISEEELENMSLREISQRLAIGGSKHDQKKNKAAKRARRKNR